MSLYGNVNMLSSAMRYFQAGLNVSSNNVMNATSVGYSRQRLVLQPLGPVLENGLQLGSGVLGTGVQRMRNVFLDTQIKLQLSDLGRASARNLALKELSLIFPEIAIPASTVGLQGAINDLSTKWTALAAAPASAAAQTAVRDALDALAVRLNTGARQVYDLQEKLDVQVGVAINEVNALLYQVASLNKQIVSSLGGGFGQEPNVLLDQREQALQKLSALIGGSYREGSDGAVTVVINGGTLVEHGNAYALRGIPSKTDPGRMGIGYYENPSNSFVDITHKVTGGKLGGLLQARDVDAEAARLYLDKIAFGYITRSNEINQTAIASDTTTNHILFTGTRANDINLNAVLRTNVSYIGSTRDPIAARAGDIATIQAAVKDILLFSGLQSAPFRLVQALPPTTYIDPTLPISSLVASLVFDISPGNPPPAAPSTFTIISGSNAYAINWDGTMSINDVINSINVGSGGSIHATFDQTLRKMFIYSQAPLQVYDDAPTGFAHAMKLSAIASSSAPINNNVVAAFNQVDPNIALNSQMNTLNLFTNTAVLIPGVPYQMQVDNSVIAWQPTDDSINLLFNIQFGTPVGERVYFTFDSARQVVVLNKSGDSGDNPNTLEITNPMRALELSDVTGNLTRVFNFDTQENAQRLFDQVVTGLKGNTSSETALEAQAQALVDGTKALQDAQSAVNLDEELAQARLYQRSYEASVRLQFILDEVLNVLINHTGSSAGSSSF